MPNEIVKRLTPLKFSYALLRRDPNGFVKTLMVRDTYAEAVQKRDYLRRIAKRKESRALFYVKMIVEEMQNAAS